MKVHRDWSIACRLCPIFKIVSEIVWVMALKSDQQRCIAHECGYRVSVEHVCLRQESFFINLYFIH